MSLPDGFELKDINGLDVLVVDTPAWEAEILLQGGHLWTARPKNHPHPLFYASPATKWAGGEAVRGGVPICWPWLGNHPERPQRPFHGPVRTKPWTLEEAGFDDDGDADINLSLLTERDPDIGTGDCRLDLNISLQEEGLCLTLAITNTGPEILMSGGALHSYIAISDIDKTHVQGLDGLLSHGPDTTFWSVEQEEALRIGPEGWGRTYHDAEEDPRTISVVDEGWDRTLVLERDGSMSALIWNPGLKGSLEIPDLTPECHRKFIAVETANVDHDRQLIAPGETHCIRFALGIAES